MKEIAYIDLKECILEDNERAAARVREKAREEGFFLWNIMSSPGAGKTTFILEAIRRLKGRFRIGVIEGDIESRVDALKMLDAGVPAVQLRTGGDCHLDAAMILKALESLPTGSLDLVIIENIGNLVCPSEFDLGAALPSMLLSVPEGDDKPLKYPHMFTVCQALMVTKTDTMPLFDFSLDTLDRNARRLNEGLRIFPLSAKTGDGMDDFCEWLTRRVTAYLTPWN